MDPMKEISQKICAPCFFGRKLAREEIVRCVKNDGTECPKQKEIDEINSIAEIEIIFH